MNDENKHAESVLNNLSNSDRKTVCIGLRESKETYQITISGFPKRSVSGVEGIGSKVSAISLNYPACQ